MVTMSMLFCVKPQSVILSGSARSLVIGFLSNSCSSFFTGNRHHPPRPLTLRRGGTHFRNISCNGKKVDPTSRSLFRTEDHDGARIVCTPTKRSGVSPRQPRVRTGRSRRKRKLQACTIKKSSATAADAGIAPHTLAPVEPTSCTGRARPRPQAAQCPAPGATSSHMHIMSSVCKFARRPTASSRWLTPHCACPSVCPLRWCVSQAPREHDAIRAGRSAHGGRPHGPHGPHGACRPEDAHLRRPRTVVRHATSWCPWRR